MYQIYIDVFFAMNLGINILILWLVKQFFRLQIKGFRIVLAGVAGAIWSCLWIVCPDYVLRWFGILTIGIVGPGMVLIAFGRCKRNIYLCRVAGFYLITVVLGGLIDVVRRILPKGLIHNRFYAILGWIFLAIGSVWLIRGCFNLILEQKRRQPHLYQVVLHYQGKIQEVTALLDTGNRLREPYGGKPVHVITYEKCKLICEKATGVLYVPFTSVGADSGVLPAICLDQMEIFQNGELVNQIKRPIVAIIRYPLSPNGEYDMLLNEEIEGMNRGGSGDDSEGFDTEPFSV